MQHKSGDQYVVLYRYSYFSNKFYIQCKNPVTCKIDEYELQRIASDLYNLGDRISDYDSVTNSYNFRKQKENIPFVDEAFRDMKEAKNPKYISYYCYILLAEIANMKKTNFSTYFPAIFPYLSKLTNVLSDDLERLLSCYLEYMNLPSDLRNEFLLALAKSNFQFRDGNYCYNQIVNMLYAFVDKKREDLRDVLIRFPVFSSKSIQADFLLEKYDGLGIKNKELPRLLCNRGKKETLYSLVMDNPSYLADYFKECGNAIELVRYLSLHGYHGQVKEMAMSLLPYIENAKDYYALRIFLSDDEVLQTFKKMAEKEDPHINFLAFRYFDKKELAQQIKLDTYYYSNQDSIALGYTYGYDSLIKGLDEYASKEMRRRIREKMGYRSFKDIYTYSIGLIEAEDKISFKYYFTPEAEERYLSDPYFCLTKAYLGLRQQKKIKDMYPYKEAK